MILPSRRTFAVGAAASVLAAAGAAQASEGDAMSIGAASAPVHLIEYASATCPHCAPFHEPNWERLKRDYIDTGRVRLTLSEMLTPPPAVALAMFQVARCGDANAEEYFRRMAVLFASQRRIFESGTVEGVRNALIAIG